MNTQPPGICIRDVYGVDQEKLQNQSSSRAISCVRPSNRTFANFDIKFTRGWPKLNSQKSCHSFFAAEL